MELAWLCAYDIHSNSSRSKCLKIMRSHSLIYQKSAFEIGLERSKSIELVESILANININSDRFLMLRVSAATDIWRLGEHFIGEDLGHLVVFR